MISRFFTRKHRTQRVKFRVFLLPPHTTMGDGVGGKGRVGMDYWVFCPHFSLLLLGNNWVGYPNKIIRVGTDLIIGCDPHPINWTDMCRKSHITAVATATNLKQNAYCKTRRHKMASGEIGAKTQTAKKWLTIRSMKKKRGVKKKQRTTLYKRTDKNTRITHDTDDNAKWKYQ